MKPKAYQLLERCIEDGLARGWTQAHKHVDQPAACEITEAQYNAIMLEIAGWFTFDDED